MNVTFSCLPGSSDSVDVVRVDREAVRRVLRLLEVRDVEVTVVALLHPDLSGVKWLRIAVM